MKFKTNVNSNQ